MEECSCSNISFLNNNNNKTSIVYLDLDLKGINNSNLIFCSVSLRTILFFTNYFENLDYQKRKKWIKKIHEKKNLTDKQDYYYIDKYWNNLLSKFFHKVLELESEMWRLSTLGGAVSAMGFFNEKFVKAALRVSSRQLQIAQTLGDPISIARCYLYISLGLAQKGNFRLAIFVVRGIWKENVEFLHSDFLKNCTLGVWMTIKWIKIKKIKNREN